MFLSCSIFCSWCKHDGIREYCAEKKIPVQRWASCSSPSVAHEFINDKVDKNSLVYFSGIALPFSPILLH